MLSLALDSLGNELNGQLDALARKLGHHHSYHSREEDNNNSRPQIVAPSACRLHCNPIDWRTSQLVDGIVVVVVLIDHMDYL